MSQLVTPQTIDAGTPMAASEVQQNFDAIRNWANGNIEGGTGSDSNIKANGVTARELADNLLANFIWQGINPGVLGAADLKVTAGAGLQLNYAAGSAVIADAAALVAAAGQVLPVLVGAGATVTVGNNVSGTPRIDQVILTMTGYFTGTVSVLAGTPSFGANLENRAGAAGLPAGSIRLADILMPTGFAGPFVQNTHIRDRRAWALGAKAIKTRGSGVVAVVGAAAIPELAARLETSGKIMRVSLASQGTASGGGAARLTVDLKQDGASMGTKWAETGAFGSSEFEWHLVPSAGSHLFTVEVFVDAGAADLSAPITVLYQELNSGVADNEGA